MNNVMIIVPVILSGIVGIYLIFKASIELELKAINTKSTSSSVWSVLALIADMLFILGFFSSIYKAFIARKQHPKEAKQILIGFILCNIPLILIIFLIVKELNN